MPRDCVLARLARRRVDGLDVLAVDLGGLMIKVGQFMSSRLDVLPPEITRELEGLQDEVPPVPFPRIRALAEAELGIDASERTNPLHAAGSSMAAFSVGALLPLVAILVPPPSWRLPVTVLRGERLLELELGPVELTG